MAKKAVKKKAHSKGSAHSIRTLTPAVVNVAEASKARTILQSTHDSATGLIASFADVRKHRGAGQGAPRNNEQDLLRACLVFAAAGLDSTLKQLIRDALPSLVRSDEDVREGLETFIVRQTRGDPDGGEAAFGRKFLAKILVADNHLDALIEQYILSLTGSSLQSADELAKATSALGLKQQQVGVDHKTLRPIFGIRNKIIHELDINLDAKNRNRESRRRNEMVRHSNALLDIGEKILVAVEKKIAGNA